MIYENYRGLLVIQMNVIYVIQKKEVSPYTISKGTGILVDALIAYLLHVTLATSLIVL